MLRVSGGSTVRLDLVPVRALALEDVVVAHGGRRLGADRVRVTPETITVRS
jgi:hypothetical protein